jgi:peptidase S41-like protein
MWRMLAVWPIVMACGARSYKTTHTERGEAVALTESFSGSTLNAGWVADVPPVRGAEVRLDNGEVRLTMPPGADGKVSLRIRTDAAQMRGKRLRLVGKLRTDAALNSLAHATITVAAGSRASSYGDLASSRVINSAPKTAFRAAVDVASDATSIEVTLVLDGPGTAWFDDVELSVVGPTNAPQRLALVPRQVSNLVTFARAVATIRYLHPSDAVADTDWDDFIAAAIDRVLRAGDQQALLEALRTTFSEVAPAVTFTNTTDRTVPRPPKREDGTHLARWRRYGPGTTGLFTTFREGRDPDAAVVEWLTRVHVAAPRQCGTIRLRAKAHTDETGTVDLFVRRLDPGTASKEFTTRIAKDPQAVVIAAELNAGASELEVGIRAAGRCEVSLEGFSLSCDAGPAPPVDLVHSAWTARGFAELYQWQPNVCTAGTCATLRRAPLDTMFVPDRDLSDVEIGEGIRAQVPLAVWADDTKTFPVSTVSVRSDTWAINDLPLRLAAIISAWSSLSILYPYFDDLHINWLAALPAALNEAAVAGSPADLHAALWHLLVQLRDDHIKVLHPAVSVDGALPIAFRRFEGKIVVIGGMSEYMTGIAAGDELVSLDGIPAVELYERMTEKVSAATNGWREYVTPYRMSAGPIGTFRRLVIRDNAGRESSLSLPLIFDNLYDHFARDPRPKSGSELAPGILYVDFDGLSLDDWSTLLPSLQRARGIIFDFRGYSGRTAFAAFSNLADAELSSPIWQVPVIGENGRRRYLASNWNIRPAPPRLGARIVALTDGRAVSAMETVLQIFQVNRLGLLVGETSAGSNGNVGWLNLPGGFRVRFSGLRAAYADGTTIQGHGVVPDRIVHPTLDGIRAGRDEILEAGIQQLQQLSPP